MAYELNNSLLEKYALTQLFNLESYPLMRVQNSENLNHSLGSQPMAGRIKDDEMVLKISSAYNGRYVYAPLTRAGKGLRADFALCFITDKLVGSQIAVLDRRQMIKLAETQFIEIPDNNFKANSLR